MYDGNDEIPSTSDIPVNSNAEYVSRIIKQEEAAMGGTAVSNAVTTLARRLQQQDEARDRPAGPVAAQLLNRPSLLLPVKTYTASEDRRKQHAQHQDGQGQRLQTTTGSMKPRPFAAPMFVGHKSDKVRKRGRDQQQPSSSSAPAPDGAQHSSLERTQSSHAGCSQEFTNLEVDNPEVNAFEELKPIRVYSQPEPVTYQTLEQFNYHDVRHNPSPHYDEVCYDKSMDVSSYEVQHSHINNSAQQYIYQHGDIADLEPSSPSTVSAHCSQSEFMPAQQQRWMRVIRGLSMHDTPKELTMASATSSSSMSLSSEELLECVRAQSRKRNQDRRSVALASNDENMAPAKQDMTGGDSLAWTARDNDQLNAYVDEVAHQSNWLDEVDLKDFKPIGQQLATGKCTKKKKKRPPGSFVRQEAPAMLNGYPRPQWSYSAMIAMALRNSNDGCLTVSEIYAFVLQNFPYFRTANCGWKNSVRHNLSLNKCFAKVDTGIDGNGARKSCLWSLNPARQDKLEQEFAKFRQKDPSILREGLANPNDMEAIEDGTKGIPDEDTCRELLQNPMYTQNLSLSQDWSVSVSATETERKPSVHKPQYKKSHSPPEQVAPSEVAEVGSSDLLDGHLFSFGLSPLSDLADPDVSGIHSMDLFSNNAAHQHHHHATHMEDEYNFRDSVMNNTLSHAQPQPGLLCPSEVMLFDRTPQKRDRGLMTLETSPFSLRCRQEASATHEEELNENSLLFEAQRLSPYRPSGRSLMTEFLPVGWEEASRL